MKKSPASKDRVTVSAWVAPVDVQHLDELAHVVGGTRSLVMIAAIRAGLAALAADPSRVAAMLPDYLRARRLASAKQP